MLNYDTRPSPQSSASGIHLIGDFAGHSGLCQSGRGFLELFKAMDVPTECLDLPLGPDRRLFADRLTQAEFSYSQPTSQTSLIAWNGDAYPMLARDLPKDLFNDRRIIGLWFWETETLPDNRRCGYDFVDEVWATSQFVADCVKQQSPVPVRRLPHPLIPPKPPSQLVLPPELQNDRFVFLFSFDYRSSRGRKNPEGVCEAFVRAFPTPSPDGPICALKSLGGTLETPLVYLELQQQYGHREDIVFLDGSLDDVSHDSLLARANCYVSLHRSEGLGLTLMESMALGKPCIATAYSGNLEFMTEKNSWLVPYRKVPIGPGWWPYPEDQMWAEPDLDVAALAMKQVYENPQLAAQVGALGQQSVLTNHSLEAVAKVIRGTLEELQEIPLRTKPGFQESPAGKLSGRAQAYLTQKEAKQQEQKTRKACSSLRSWRTPSEVRECMMMMMEIFKLQRQTHAHILNELGAIKKRLKNYDGSKIDGLIRDSRMMESLLTSMLINQNAGGPPSRPDSHKNVIIPRSRSNKALEPGQQ